MIRIIAAHMSWLAILIQLICLAIANVEKTIFIAPEPLSTPQDAAIDNLLLEPLHAKRLSVRTYLNASFPTEDKPRGEETWALLEGLTPGQRYELRICWLATQPTTFWIATYTLAQAFETAELITSLSTFSYARHAHLSQLDQSGLLVSRFDAQTDLKSRNPQDKSLLFLRIQAAADYFSLNKTLMEHVPPVHVDLILDPYLLNIFPQSLVPTAGYIAVIAVFAWFLSGWIYRQMIAYVKRNQSTDGRSAAMVIEKKKGM